MRAKFIIGMAVVLVLALFMFAFSQGTKTLKGKLVGITCYVTEGSKETECTTVSLKPGEPIGFLEKDTGRLYLIARDPERVIPFAEKIIEVNGTLHERSGINVIEIKDIKEAKKETDNERNNHKKGITY